jgi:DNA-binding beta-propeller fold protein YncE
MRLIASLRWLLPAIPLAFAVTLRSADTIPNTGQQITPLAPSGARFEALNPDLPEYPKYTAGQAVTSVVSPDGKTLLVLTSGYNLLDSPTGALIAQDSTQFVFVYDISQGLPVRKQVIKVPNSYAGIVFAPSGQSFYVSGGVDDDVHAFSLGQNGVWAEQPNSPFILGHGGLGVGLDVKPQAAGIAITADGEKLVVANYYNDSISVLRHHLAGWSLSSELDLRPGKEDPNNSGVPGGEYPLWVVTRGDDTAYVSSVRDREIDVVNIRDKAKVVARISLTGQPNRMVLNRSQDLLYVTQDNSDSVAVIDTRVIRLRENIFVTAPAGVLPDSKAKLKGNNTNSLTLSPDEKVLYVTNGWMNDVAVVQLGTAAGNSRVIGLIPTGWYPNSLSFSSDGKYIYVVNGKSPTGPNPGHCSPRRNRPNSACGVANEYNLQLIKAGLQSFPNPSSGELQVLTQQVALNNHFKSNLSQEDATKLAFLRSHIKHVIYIVKENRTYDQVLGDLEVGNGDPNLTEFPEATTPNEHKLAREFVTLDNFYDTSEVSYDGWSWSTSARAPDLVEKQVTINYAGRGLSYDSEGTNRNINIALASPKERIEANPLTPEDPDVLPGTRNAAAPDGPDGENGTGYLWNAALRRGLTVRNYGFFVDLSRYSLPVQSKQFQIPLLLDPAASKTQVAYPADAALAKYTDIYFRSFDNAFPDFYRYKDWEREFDRDFANGGLPNLSLVRFMHDHTGSFREAILGVNTPELQVADNDYAVGLLVEKIANSRYKDDTLVFVIEDDSQSGADHVDSHRSIAFIAGPYVRHKAVISSPYTTISMLRTMEEILGIGTINLNDASANPMTSVFDLQQKDWSYRSLPSDLLAGTQLPIAKARRRPVPHPTHDAKYWAEATAGMDFSVEDRVDPIAFNRILWAGIMGSKPYPITSTGRDLRENRRLLLERFHLNQPRDRQQSSGSSK